MDKRCNILGLWEEAAGRVKAVDKHRGIVRLELSRRDIVEIPLDKIFLDGWVFREGNRVAVLHTDIPGKEYLFRMRGDER